jgi:putative ABC transport system permease protein
MDEQMESLLRDVRFAIRGLARSPLIVSIAVATVAVGIASTTVVFSIVNATMLQPLRYGNPDRLVLVWMARRHKAGYGNPPAQVYLAWRERAKSFESLAALADASFDLRGNPPVRVGAAEATANFFPAVEVQPVVGRVFTEEEARSGAHVVVLGHALWKNRFASDPNIAGKTVVLSGAQWTVIGVMPADFSFIRHHDLWVPMDLAADRLKVHNALMPVAKLRRDLSAAQANAEMDAIQQQIIREMPNVAASTFNSARLMPMRDVLLGGSARRMMIVLLGAVGFVLLIACVNVANLLLARGASRQKEIAVRFSLGATRLRIVRQLLAEAAVLGTLGAAAGLTLAWAGVRYLSTLSLLQWPGTPPLAIDLSVLVFVAAVSTLTVIAAGMLPAWQTSDVAPMETLKDASAARLGSARHQRLRNMLVMAEVALSVVLLVSGGLLVRRFVNLLHSDPGIDPTGVLTMDITRGRDTAAEAARNFYDRTLERVGALPGVEAVAVSNTLPMVGWNYGVPFRRPEDPKEVAQRQYGMLNVVSAGYFSTLRLAILRGRAFNAQDSATATPVVIVNRKLAERCFRDEDPIGKTLLVATPDDKVEIARHVVGIAGDVKDSGIEAPIAEDVYLPFEQYPVPWEYLSVRSRSDPTALAGSIRAAIAAVDKDQPLDDVLTMQQRIDYSIRWSRFATSLLGGFAGLSLLLAVVGIYGVVAYTTAQRTAEFGLRMALGARPATVLRLAMNSGTKLVLAGSGIGIAAGVAVARLLSSAVEGINPRDPVVFVAALVLIVAAALPATLLPARRASKIDPMVALRHE